MHILSKTIQPHSMTADEREILLTQVNFFTTNIM